jgi:hypothetical protein
MTTAERMKIMGMKNDQRLDAKIPALLKDLVMQYANCDNMTYGAWIKMALLEKIERATIAE